MRLDHLLSMETMTAFHGAVGVEKHDERRFKRSSTELLLFNFQGSDKRELGGL